MLSYPPAKINLGLHIRHKRQDGFHEIESLMLPVPFTDILEIVPNSGEPDVFIQTGIPLEGNPDENLVIKALTLFRMTFPVPALKIHLHKIIPAGAGLGGGSSDAASVLKALNSLTRAGLSVPELEQMAAQMGSDCAFFIRAVPAFATGRGEILNPFPSPLNGMTLLLVVPPVHSNTARAYQGIRPSLLEENLKDILSLGPDHWKEKLNNDFEPSVFQQYPILRQIKDELYRKGARYAAMSGSGSALFGIFDTPATSVHFPGCRWRKMCL